MRRSGRSQSLKPERMRISKKRKIGQLKKSFLSAVIIISLKRKFRQMTLEKLDTCFRKQRTR